MYLWRMSFHCFCERGQYMHRVCSRGYGLVERPSQRGARARFKQPEVAGCSARARSVHNTHALVVGVPPGRGTEVVADGEAKGGEEDGGDEHRVAAEEGVVDLLSHNVEIGEWSGIVRRMGRTSCARVHRR
jgi:hypothetical protein